MKIAGDWPDLKWIEEHFGLRHTIEIIVFVGGVLLAKYLAGRFWDKKRKAPEVFLESFWVLVAGWYCVEIYSRSARQATFGAVLLSFLTCVWLASLWFVLHLQERTLAKLIEAGKVLQKQGLFRDAASKYSQSLANSAINHNRKLHLECLNRLGHCELQFGEREVARTHFNESVALAIEWRNAYWRSRGHCGLGLLDYLGGASDAARQQFDQALSISIEKRDALGQAIAKRHLGDLDRYLGHEGPARDNYTTALGIFREKHDDVGEAGVLRGLGDLELMHGLRGEEAVANLRKAHQIYVRLNHAPGMANTELSLGQVERINGDSEAARQHFSTARGTFQRLGDRLGEANALLYQGEVDRAVGESAEARRNFVDAIALYNLEKSQEGKANCLRGLGHIYLTQGNLKNAEESFGEAKELYLREADHLGQGYALAGLGDLEAIRGNYPLSRKLFADALELFAKEGSESSKASVWIRAGGLDCELANFDSARSLFDKACQTLGKGSPLEAATATVSLGHLECILGNYAAARQCFQSSESIFAKRRDIYGEAEAGRGLAEVDFEEGSIESAIQRYTDARVAFQKIEHALGEADVLLLMAALERSRRNHDLAYEYLEKAKSIFEGSQWRMRLADVLCERGQLAHGDGALSDAKGYFVASRKIYEHLGAPLGRARVDYAEGLLKNPEARDLLKRALDTFKKLGLPKWVERAENEIQRS